MRWLITGGCGFIGTNLVNNLMAEGNHTIRIIDNCSVSSYQNTKIAHHTQIIHGDIKNKQLALNATKNIDIVVHLAANTGVPQSIKNPHEDCETNILGTLNYLEAARQRNIKRFIFASSGAVVGNCQPPTHEELFQQPISPYGASKLAGESYCHAYCKSFGLDTVILRFSNVYGPHSKHKTSVISKFIKSGMTDKILKIYDDGQQTRDFIYVDDLVRTIKLAADTKNYKHIGGEIFQVATGIETYINFIALEIESILQNTGIKNLKIGLAPARKGDIYYNYADISKTKEIFNWQPEVNIFDGLQHTVDWFIKNG